MAHMRTQIRDAVEDVLSGLATTGANVFKSRIRPLDATQIPAVVISTLLENSGVAGAGGSKPLLARRVTVFVEAVVQRRDGYEEQVDQIALEVETALGSNKTLGGLVKNVEPKGYEIQFSDDTEKPVAVGKMTFEALYFTSQGVPDQHM